jgi:hypothetical protein
MIIVAFDGWQNDPDLIGCTELNGNGCVCHSQVKDLNVDVWVEGPDTLHVGQMGIYKMFLAGGPAEAGGYNVAGRYGTMELVDTFSFKHPLTPNELTQAFSLPFPTTGDTIYWKFGYLASDSTLTDTIYSCGLSLVWDTIPDSLDRWNFGTKFPLTIMPVTNIEDEYKNLPINFTLEQNYPNPFNPTTYIKFTISDLRKRHAVPVQLDVYDILGNKVVNLVEEEKPTGIYEVDFNATGLPSGIYFYRIKSDSYVETKKMILMR